LSFFNFIGFKKNFFRFFFFNQLDNKYLFNNNIIFYFLFFIFDITKLILNKSNFFLIRENIRLKYKNKQTNNNYIYTSNNNFNNNFMLKSFLIGLKYLWLGLRMWLLPNFFFITSFFFMFFSKLIPLYKISFVFFILLSFIY